MGDVGTKMIVISGKAQSGKDTVARFLARQMAREGYNVKILHFADLLKYICRELYGWNGNKDKQGRELLQFVGTDIVRRQNRDFWANYITDIVLMFGDYMDWDFVIVPDCRFDNEITIPAANGIRVFHAHIVRDGYESGLSEKQQRHESETALKDVIPDYTLINDGSLFVLESKVESLFVRILLWGLIE